MALSMMSAFLVRSLLTNYHLVLLLSVFLLTKSAKGDILVYQQDQLLEEFRDFPATFGGDIPESGIKVRAVRASPYDGCSAMDGPPENVSEIGVPTRFAVIIARYNCSFEEKIRNAQKAGFVAVIVHNVGSNDLERMSANHAEDIIIPSVFIGESNGIYIIESFLYPLPYALIITDDIPFNINNNLIIPFAIVVGLCFIIMVWQVCFMIIRCIRERRRMMRHRLPNSVLKKIPIVKFAKGMQYDTCAICLDDYVDNERLRVLPCHHAYHVKCIDPWLTKNRRVCPICKRKVFARGERRPPRRRSSTDSMSSSDADEHTPLLNPVNNQPTAAGSTSAPALAPVDGAAATSSPRHPRGPNDSHVVNVASDDEEMLDAATVQARALQVVRQMGGAPQRRFNPFDRVQQSSSQPGTIEDGGESPYSPIGEDQSNTSAWSRFVSKLRFYVRNQPRPEEILSDDDDDVEPATGESLPIATASRSSAAASNNILNSNLSGSFHGDETTDDEMVGASFRDEAKRRQIRSAPNLPSTSGMASGSLGSGGGGGGGRLGVAALPNVNFNPSQVPSRSSGDPGRRQNRSGGGASGSSGGHYPV